MSTVNDNIYVDATLFRRKKAFYYKFKDLNNEKKVYVFFNLASSKLTLESLNLLLNNRVGHSSKGDLKLNILTIFLID
jgi:hypothetical protein